MHVAKLSDQISVRIDPDTRDILREIESRHRISPPEFVRGLLDAGIHFYQERGFFSFPVEIRPKRDFIQAVAETQAAYGKKIDPPSRSS